MTAFDPKLPLGAADQTITDSRFVDDYRRAGWIRLHFLPQASNSHPQIFNLAFVGRSPDRPKQVGVGEYSPGMLREFC